MHMGGVPVFWGQNVQGKSVRRLLEREPCKVAVGPHRVTLQPAFGNFQKAVSVGHPRRKRVALRKRVGQSAKQAGCAPGRFTHNDPL
jgi:hypothetical protein